MYQVNLQDQKSASFYHYFYRDVDGSQHLYEAISVIEFNGRLSSIGESEGHYICDIKDKASNFWFRTNDAANPTQIESSDVSKYGYVIMYKRV